MSKGPVIVVLILAVLLGGLTFFVLKKPTPTSGEQPVAWLASLDASQVKALRVLWEDGKPGAQFSREPVTGEWLLTAPGTTPWPVAVERMRPFLRLMNDVARVPAEADASLSGGSTTLEFAMVDGSARTVRIGSAPLGGKVLAMIDTKGEGSSDSRGVLIDDGIRKMVQPESLVAWRDARLVPRAGVEPSRVYLENAATKLAISRVQGRWGITSPMICPASEDAMKALVRQIASMKGDRIMDEVDANGPIVGASEPVLVVRLESDLRITSGSDIQRRTLVEEVRVGKPADMSGVNYYATVAASVTDAATNASTALWGPTTIVIPKDKLETLKADVAAYASKRSLPFPGADVNGISLALDAEPMGAAISGASGATEIPPANVGHQFKLTLKGWAAMDSSGGVLPLEGASAAGVAGLARALGDIDSAAIGSTASEEVRPLARCTVTGVGGAGSETVRLGVGTDAGRTILVVQNGPVFRVYNDEWVAGLVGWIRSVVKPGE